MFDLAVKNALVYENSQFREANLYVKDGRIALIGSQDYEAERILEGKGKKLIPGIIDPHVHLALNVGRYTSADDFYTGSRAGLYGGVTSYIDFLDPLSRGQDVPEAFLNRKRLAEKSLSDYSFHVTAANPVGETESIVQAALDLNVPSVKIFTAYSDSGRRTFEREITEFMKLSEKRGFTLLIHSEDEEYIEQNGDMTPASLPFSRPVVSETSMVKKIFTLARKWGGRTYIVHTTCGESLEELRAMPDILFKKVFLESCPQYFYLNDSVFSQPDGCRYVLAPPLRPKAQQEKLISLVDTLYTIGTDHCPFMKGEKNKKRLVDTPFGIGGIEFSFPLMYSLFGDKIIDKMTKNPAQIFQLYPRKGELAEGADGDFFLFDDRNSMTIGTGHSQCDDNLYEGLKVVGRVETTVVRGEIRMDKGVIKPGKGEFLPRGVF
jgi:dihydropyrimidinase